MKSIPVRIVTINYSGEMGQVFLDADPRDSFDSKDAAIDFLHNVRYHKSREQNGLTPEQHHDLTHSRYAAVGQDHVYILYPDEQRQWIKRIVRDLV